MLMFAFGGVNLLWMLALAAVMSAERRANYLASLLGVLLILAAPAL